MAAAGVQPAQPCRPCRPVSHVPAAGDHRERPHGPTGPVRARPCLAGGQLLGVCHGLGAAGKPLHGHVSFRVRAGCLLTAAAALCHQPAWQLSGPMFSWQHDVSCVWLQGAHAGRWRFHSCHSRAGCLHCILTVQGEQQVSPSLNSTLVTDWLCQKVFRHGASIFVFKTASRCQHLVACLADIHTLLSAEQGGLSSCCRQVLAEADKPVFGVCGTEHPQRLRSKL